MIHLEDLLRVTIDYVKHSKPNQFRQIQTYAFLDEYADLESDNLNKAARDIDKIYFFNRSSLNPSDVSYDVPILCLYEVNSDVEDILTSPKIKTKLEVAVLDKYDDLSKSKDPRSSRTRNEIYRDTRVLLIQYFRYLGECKYYTGHGVYHHTMIESGWQVDEVKTREWSRLFNKGSYPLSNWDGGIRTLRGNFTQIDIEYLQCSEYTYDVEKNTVTYKGDFE